MTRSVSAFSLVTERGGGLDKKYLGVGIALGVAIGVATGNLAIGIALGVVFGLVAGKYKARQGGG